MTRATQTTKNSAAGPDKIHNGMLKHLQPVGSVSILALCKKTWPEGYFPEKSLASTLIPLSKHEKNALNLSNFRIIALTSVVCKVTERMVSVRLLDIF